MDSEVRKTKWYTFKKKIIYKVEFLDNICKYKFIYLKDIKRNWCCGSVSLPEFELYFNSNEGYNILSPLELTILGFSENS